MKAGAISLRLILRERGLIANNITTQAAEVYGVADIARPMRGRIHWAVEVPPDFPDWGVIVVNKFTDSKCTQIRHRHKNPRLVFCEIFDNYFRPNEERKQTIFIDRTCVTFDHENSVKIGPFASIGTEGIGAEWDGEALIPYPQQGRVVIGAFVMIGPGTTIRRGSLGVTHIGTGSKIGANCTIGHNVQMGKHCMVFGGVTIAGSAVIGDRVQIGIGAVIRNKVTIGAGAVIGMGAVVTKDVREGATVKGNPAK